MRENKQIKRSLEQLAQELEIEVLELLIEKDLDGWTLQVTLLPGCGTRAKTLDEMFDKIKEVIRMYLEDMLGHGG